MFQKKLSADFGEELNCQSVLEDILRNVPGAIFQYWVFPDGSDAIRYMSDGCFCVWEISAAELHNDPTPIWDMVLPEDATFLRNSIGRSARFLESWDQVWRILTPSGKLKWLQGRAQPNRLEDGTVLFNCLVLDSTERIEARQQVRDRDWQLAEVEAQLAELARTGAVTEVTASIAHEINQPLGATVNYLSAARSAVDAAADDVQILEYLDLASAQAHRAADIVKQLRALFERAPLVKEERALNQLVEEAIRIVGPDRVNGIEVVTVFDEAIQEVAVERIQILQVLVNLLCNAVDALADVDRPRIRVETWQTADEVAVVVADNGGGIPEALAADVFKPFHSTKADGLGVGLSLSRNIVLAHDGTLEHCASAEGGAHFTMRLPRGPQ